MLPPSVGLGKIATARRFKKEQAMHPSTAECELRDRFLQAMLEATFPLQAGADQELTLQALIGAAELLKQRFEQELEELRREEAE